MSWPGHSIIFGHSWQSGKVPEDWKKTEVCLQEGAHRGIQVLTIDLQAWQVDSEVNWYLPELLVSECCDQRYKSHLEATHWGGTPGADTGTSTVEQLHEQPGQESFVLSLNSASLEMIQKQEEWWTHHRFVLPFWWTLTGWKNWPKGILSCHKGRCKILPLGRNNPIHSTGWWLTAARQLGGEESRGPWKTATWTGINTESLWWRWPTVSLAAWGEVLLPVNWGRWSLPSHQHYFFLRQYT